MDFYDIGDLARLSAAFVNASSAAADPTEAVLRIQPPSGAAIVYRWPTPAVGESALAHDGAGAFHADVSLTASGHWSYRFEGVGAVQSAEESVLYVRKSAF